MHSLAKTKVLHQILSGILGAVVSGCSEFPNPNALAPSADWTGISCDADNKMDLLTDLQPTEHIDGLSLYTIGIQASFLREAGGPPCSQAVNPVECEQTLHSLSHSFNTNALLVTKGDIVQVLQSESEVKTFLGELDNPQKVFSWMHVHGMSLSCTFDDSAVKFNNNLNAWQGVYTEITSSCSPVVTERVLVNVNLVDYSISEVGRAEIRRQDGVCIGRKPPGTLTFNPVNNHSACNSLGQSLARHAAYEAASVVAFEHLKKELASLGAPEYLLKRIEKAANDERRHAEQVAILAYYYGYTADTFSVKPTSFRDIETIAIDNIQEGCIGETWGALVGLYQAEKAKDPIIADTMRKIGLDEVGHASFSWEIQDWLLVRLSNSAKERVHKAQKNAIKKLKENIVEPYDQSHMLLAGLPEPHVAKQLADKLIQSLPV